MPNPTTPDAPSLVIVAHGSRRTAANVEIAQLVEQIAHQAREQYAKVTYGFLEMAEPSIPDAIQSCITAGATKVLVAPYFLAAGRHVTDDIPYQVQLKQVEYPEIDIQVKPYLGSVADMPALLLQIADL